LGVEIAAQSDCCLLNDDKQFILLTLITDLVGLSLLCVVLYAVLTGSVVAAGWTRLWSH